MEEKSGIGGSVVRTTSKKATGKGKRAAGAQPSEEPAEANQVAEEVFTGESNKVVANLAERTIRGCSRGLHELKELSNTEPGEEEPEATRKEFSQAMAWMSEPEWNGESSEGLSETFAGSREPECTIA